MRTKAGHLRYTSPKELRGEYVHRKVIRDLLAETPYSIRLLLPNPYEVHHCDYNKENCEPSNLLLLDIVFHSHLTAHRLKRQFRPKWKPIPELMLWDEQEQSESEVPF